MRQLTLALGVVTIVTAMLVSVAGPHGSDGMLIVGPIAGSALYEALALTGCALIAVGLCTLPVARVWLWLLVPTRIVAVGFLAVPTLFALSATDTTATKLTATGCDTGFVAVEHRGLLSARSTVYAVRGLVGHSVGTVATERLTTPFAAGAYTVRRSGDELLVWASATGRSAVDAPDAVGEPSARLPINDGAPTCVHDVRIGDGTGPETAADPVAYTIAELDDALRAMAQATASAADVSLYDATGAYTPRDQLRPTAGQCSDGRGRRELVLGFPADLVSANTVLRAWSNAGYRADDEPRSRVSSRLPVARVDVAREGSLLLVHMTSQCLAR